ncbi:L,D-transpeptidase family protein [Mycoplana sp. MJR14]|uniref:L,D-transpeptidase family protein n=1 Tax=Mycoplana sp. MJR14 TaxID=3032583 RepID=UPI0023DCC06F|nr:L,D-transpeptidase family protein [Mycoplana sp. MJR14]MDF1633962.1 L,D-transpeptidase family protein [Mycoplana sp. MJR14]
MTLKKSAALTALLITCAVTVADVAPAYAAQPNLLELLFGKRRRQEPVPPPGVNMPMAAPGPAVATKPAPLPKVSAPSYYTYKADPLKTIALDKVADPVVTGSIDVATVDAAPHTPEGDVRREFASVKAEAPAESARAVEDFYSHNTGLIWVSGSQISDRARAALAVLADAASTGLDPQDYAVQVPSAVFDSANMAARYQELAAFEVNLSSAVATYVLDTVRGRINPNRISGYHDFARKDVNLVAALKILSMSPDVAAYLKSREPSGAHFQALKAELKALKAESDASEPVVIAPGTLLKPGESNPELANIVKGVVKHGSDALRSEQAATIAAYKGTPDYTPELVALVEAFQKERGLKADGIVGQATIRHLVGGDSVADRIFKVQVAMEQARWLPAELGSRYVFINQPAFMAYYHDQDMEKFSMRVVVGSKSNQTYFFEDEIQTVEYNPYWGVPQSIIINEMLPKLRSDPSYLDRLGYQVELNGRAVSSSQINWGSTKGVSVRQPPGDDNALGELKILFPNAHAIYMHDTPSKSYFKKDMRALSHGCVRLADPRLMAAAVLGTSVEQVGAEIAKGRNKAVSVPERIPVYVSYFTAWPNKDGKVEFFDDVYGRDAYMRKAMEATRQVRQAQS